MPAKNYEVVIINRAGKLLNASGFYTKEAADVRADYDRRIIAFYNYPYSVKVLDRHGNVSTEVPSTGV